MVFPSPAPGRSPILPGFPAPSRIARGLRRPGRGWAALALAVCALACAGTAAAQGLWQDGAFALYRQAGEAMTNKDYATADRLLAEAIKDYPRHVLAHFMLGQSAAAQAQWAGAAAAFTRVVELYPGSVAGHRSLGAAAAELGRLDEATRAYETALKLSPSDDELRARLGAVLVRAGREPEALVLIRDLADRNSTVPEVWITLGRISFEKGDLPEAEKAFVRATALRDDGPIWFNLGVVRLKRDNPAGALQAFERARTHAVTFDQATKEIERLKSKK